MKYKVKLLNGHKATPFQTTETGYLGTDKSEAIYTRGEAIKKARMFGGKIEAVKLSSVFRTVSITQIPENALLDKIVKELRGREMFTDVDVDFDERIYSGDIFEAILNEYAELEDSPMYPQEKVMKQLDELAQMIDTEYVQIVMG